MDLWVDDRNETAWDYIGIIDTTLTSSRVDIYRYEDRFVPDATLPSIYGAPQWSKATRLGLSSSDRIAEVLQPLIEFVNNTVPEQQLARTPLYVYGSGTFRNMEAKARHNLLQSSCEYVKSHANNLVSDCSKHITWIEGYQQAILGWIAGNYYSQGVESPTSSVGIIDITPSGVHLAYHLNSDSTKMDLYRLGLRAANGTALYTDLHADFYNLVDFLDNDKLATCIRKGSQLFEIEGNGNFTECKANVGAFVKSLVDSVSPVPEPVAFYGTKGFSSFYGKFHAHEEAIEQFCNGSGSGESDAQATDCLDAVISQQIIENLGALPNVTINPTPNPEAPGEWTLGRALLYADVDLSTNGGQNIGIHENIGSKRWFFGQSDTVARPKLGEEKGDWAARLDSKSHRLWGGAILLIALVALIYLLLGKAGRSRIWAAITRSPKQPGWNKVATDETYELDDVALGEDADEEFEV